MPGARLPRRTVQLERAGAFDGGGAQHRRVIHGRWVLRQAAPQARGEVHLPQHVWRHEHDVVRAQCKAHAGLAPTGQVGEPYAEDAVAARAGDRDHILLPNLRQVVSRRVDQVHEQIGLPVQHAGHLRATGAPEGVLLCAAGFGGVDRKQFGGILVAQVRQ